MIYEASAASGLFFWLALFVAFLLVAWPLGNDNSAGAVIAAAAFVIGFVLLTDVVYRVGVWALVLILPIYILIGVGWALFKWRGHVLEHRAKAKAIYEAYRAIPLANMAPPATEYQSFAQWTGKQFPRPTAAANKDRITGWMALWPWSMSWVVLRFPWRAIVWTYNRISTVFERWSAKLWQE